MSGIALADRYDGQKTPEVTRDGFDIRHARLFHLIANVRRSQQLVAMLGAGGGTIFRRGGDDRIITMIEPMDFNQRLELFAAGIITGPFAERSFFFALVRQKFAFDSDFSIGGNG